MTNSTSFGIQESVFGLDISYYIFQKPMIEMFVLYFTVLFVGLSIYMALYYVIVFNRFFDGVDGQMLKDSLFIKKLTRNIICIIIGVALMTVLNAQNTVFGTLITVNDTDIIGAGMIESTIQLWGYVIFAFVIIIFSYKALKQFKKGNTNKVLKNLAVIPGYLVALFIIMLATDLLFVNSNELDKEKEYIAENIRNTKNAYNINIEETNLENSGTITTQEVMTNSEVIENIPIISKEAVLKTLQDSQTGTGYFSYRNANLAKYEIDGEDQVVYIAPREIVNKGRTYNNKTYEYTHGMGQIIASATESTEAGNVQYIQKEVEGKDEKINFSKPMIQIYNQVRGLNSWPGAYTILEGKRIKVWECKMSDKHYSHLLDGKITAFYEEGIGVKVSNGEIILTVIQPEGKPKMKASDFIHGIQKKEEFLTKSFE